MLCSTNYAIEPAISGYERTHIKVRKCNTGNENSPLYRVEGDQILVNRYFTVPSHDSKTDYQKFCMTLVQNLEIGARVVPCELS